MTRRNRVNELNKYILSLRGKCVGITDLNKDIILQYCRFAILADDTSVKIEKKVKEDAPPEEIEGLMKLYERFHKTVLNLHKVLKFDTLKDDAIDEDNPFARLIKEQQTNDDF